MPQGFLMSFPRCLHGIALTLYSFFLFFCSCTFARKTNTLHDVEKEAQHLTVDRYKWVRVPAVNTYLHVYLARELKRHLAIRLRQIPIKVVAEIIRKLAMEKLVLKSS